MTDDDGASRTSGLFGWINRHIGVLSIVLVLGAVGFAIAGFLVADTDEPNFSPSGEIYETEARAEEVFSSSSPIREATFLVDDASGQDVLTRDALLEFLTNSDAVRSDGDNQAHLVTVFDTDLGVEIAGVFSIADAVDAALPSGLVGRPTPTSRSCSPTCSPMTARRERFGSPWRTRRLPSPGRWAARRSRSGGLPPSWPRCVTTSTRSRVKMPARSRVMM